MRDFFERGEFVRVAGPPVGYTVEENFDARRIDHINILVRIDRFGTVAIALSTFSVRSVNAGFDGRVRIAALTSNWTALPPAGVSRSGGLDYAVVEANNRLVYTELERPALESLLIERIGRAPFVEAWGEFYIRFHRGIHQVHSRRRSCAVSEDYLGRDGAVRFYFKQHSRAELLLLKFCGQV